MLEAHQSVLERNFFLKSSFKSVSFFSVWVNFKFPMFFIFFAPSIPRYFLDCSFDAKQISNFRNKFFAVSGNFNHLLKDFFVILALSKINGIDFFLTSVIIFGHISESTNIATDGLQ